VSSRWCLNVDPLCRCFNSRRFNSAYPLHLPSDKFATKLRYNSGVRRLLSIVLLVIFSFPLISPVLALAGGPDANLPACCRRGGAHQCMLKMKTADATGTAVSLSATPPRCPAFPAVVTQAKRGDMSFHAASLIFAEIVSHPSVRTQTEACARVALDRSRQKRGPPVDLL
jgi:hypothetical protein